MNKKYVCFLILLLILFLGSRNAYSLDSSLSDEDEGMLLTAILRPEISSMEIEVIQHIIDYDARIPPEEEIEQMIEEEYQRSVSSVSGRDARYDPRELRSAIEKGVRESLNQKFSKTLRQQITYSGHQYKCLIDRTVSTPQSTGDYQEKYVNYGDRKEGDYLHYNIDILKKRAYIRESTSMWKRYDYKNVGIPGNPTLLCLFDRPEEKDMLIAAGWDARLLENIHNLEPHIAFDINRSVHWEGKIVDEILVKDKETGRPVIVYRFDSENYNLYYEAAFFPRTDNLEAEQKLMYEKRYDNYQFLDTFQSNYPFYSRIEFNKSDGTPKILTEVNVMNVKINEVVDPQTYELSNNIDDTYTIIDLRYDPPLTVMGGQLQEAVDAVFADPCFQARTLTSMSAGGQAQALSGENEQGANTGAAELQSAKVSDQESVSTNQHKAMYLLYVLPVALFVLVVSIVRHSRS